MASRRKVDYYAILEVSPTATPQQIREGYKKAALKHHPDRVAADSPERAARTKRFQKINDAYYTLSDAGRRREYDMKRAASSAFPGFGGDADDEDGATDDYSQEKPQDSQHQQQQQQQQQGQQQQQSGYSFPWSAFGAFFGQRSQQQKQQQQQQGHTPASEAGAGGFGSGGGGGYSANAQFASVFEEMLREQGMAEDAGDGRGARPTGKFWSVVGSVSGGAMGFIVANFPGAVAGMVAGNRLGAVRDARGKSVYAVFQELPQGEKARLLSELAAKVFTHAVGS